MNRAPGPSDRWWNEHENSCGGTFNKIKEPEGFGKKKVKEKKENEKVETCKILIYFKFLNHYFDKDFHNLYCIS